jgi:hypothetical protein
MQANFLLMHNMQGFHLTRMLKYSIVEYILMQTLDRFLCSSLEQNRLYEADVMRSERSKIVLRVVNRICRSIPSLLTKFESAKCIDQQLVLFS